MLVLDFDGLSASIVDDSAGNESSSTVVTGVGVWSELDRLDERWDIARAVAMGYAPRVSKKSNQ